MANTLSRSFCASVAITAVLALGSIPAQSQEVVPSLELPQTVTPPSASAPVVAPATPAPVIVPPAPIADAPSVAPVVSTTTSTRPTVVLPDVSAVSSNSDAAAPAPRAATRSSTAPRSDPQARANAAPAISESPVSPEAPVAAPVPEIGDTLNEGAASQTNTSAPVPVQAEAAPSADDGGNVPVGAIAGMLALLALGAGGFAAMRSRRGARPEALSSGEAVEPETAPIMASPATAVASAPEVTYSYAPAVATTYAPAPKTTYTPVVAAPETSRVAENGKRGFTMSEGPVPTGDARQRLLRQMVEATPDKANPFLSPSYRRKRARVILQHREFLQRKHDDQFDWRTYRSSTRPSTPVKPSLVDA